MPKRDDPAVPPARPDPAAAGGLPRMTRGERDPAGRLFPVAGAATAGAGTSPSVVAGAAPPPPAVPLPGAALPTTAMPVPWSGPPPPALPSPAGIASPAGSGPADPRRLFLLEPTAGGAPLPGEAARTRAGREGPLAMVVAVSAIAAVAVVAILLWTGS